VQRRAAVAAAAAALLVGAAAVVALAARDDGHRRVRAAATSTTTSSSTTTTEPPTTSTTYDLVPQATATTPPPATSSTTTTTAPLPVVTSAGAVLQPPVTPTTRTLSGTDCTALADPKANGVACGAAHAKGGATLMWLIEGSSTGAHGRHVYVFSAGSSPNTWKSVLEAVDATGSKWQSASAVVVDLSGDGFDDIAVGFRAASGGSLAMDVVEGPGSVTAHRDLPEGASRVSSGQWDTWALSAAGGAGQDDHDVIRWQGGAWRVVLRSTGAASDVPPSQF
jgi:hypothetical protein